MVEHSLGKTMLDSIFSPVTVYSRLDLQESPRIILAENGVYFWWIKSLSDIVPLHDCVNLEEYYLVYSGISPSNFRDYQ